jgi:hypothetical protein
MAKVEKKSPLPETVAAPLKKELPADQLVSVKAKKPFNTSVHGSFKLDQVGKVSAALAQQLAQLGECEIVED